MKMKCGSIKSRISLLLLVLATVLLSCEREAVVEEEIIPRYQFEMEETQSYSVDFNVNITVEAAIFSFSGEIGMTGVLELKAVESNEYGTKLEVSILNPQLEGGNSQLNTFMMTALNFVRTYMSTVYITPEGELTIFYKENPHPALQSYARILFPDFSDIEALENGMEFQTNFASKYEDNRFMNVLELESQWTRTTEDYIKIANELEVAMFEYEGFENTVNPVELALFEMEYTDLFDYRNGKLLSKNGYFFVEGSLKVSQGIIAITISLNGSGSFGMEEILEEAGS